MGTSTTVAIGGLDLPPGNYIVRIKGDNGEEATMPVIVPDYETWSAQVKQSQIESSNRETRLEINNKLTYVNDVYLEETADSIILAVEHTDQTKHSVVLREPDEALDLRHISIDDATINKKTITRYTGKRKSWYLCR
jgi:hypothetical protein